MLAIYMISISSSALPALPMSPLPPKFMVLLYLLLLHICINQHLSIIHQPTYLYLSSIHPFSLSLSSTISI